MAGKQIPKGTVEFGETSEQACLRELTEETGLDFDETPVYLGSIEHIVKSRPNTDGDLEMQIWHIYEMPFSNLPETCIHVAVGSPAEDGLGFRFFLQRLNVTPEGFDAIYARTIEFFRCYELTTRPTGEILYISL